ncbi:MAG: flagellar motor switch protein FliM [Candidatus Eisenbacteria bacterium]|uniref:Flagellar motor switch protein FliM n=1 Tax=Eiseniibacteriota bacterium TaxID=2212470 RepID=A0A849SMC3_UNCEI|nr:flagellar motor switch protein FliM [Candidatus Eisenbacteria bacterium]
MAERLTQRDIDRLLRGEGPGVGPVSEEIAPLDFANPPRLSRARRARIDAVAATIAGGLADFLTPRLRTRAEVVTKAVEILGFADAAEALGNPCATFVFSTGAAPTDRALLDFDPPLALIMVERLFGGSGDSPTELRALTGLEEATLSGLVERIIDRIRDAWSELVTFEVRLEHFERDPELLRALRPDAPALVMHLEVSFGTTRGFMTLALPLGRLESALSGVDRDAPVRDSQAELLAHVREARVDLVARLPLTRIPARRFASLAIGDVLETSLAPDTPLELCVNGRALYEGLVGQVRQRFALRIARPISRTAGDDRSPASERSHS